MRPDNHEPTPGSPPGRDEVTPGSARGRPPRFSVVVPTYNRAAEVTRAVDSVLRGEFEDFELIVVDDGSTDGTATALAAVRDPRVVTLRRSNQGRSAARNAGAREARGELLTFLDSDDEAAPSWLAGFQAKLADPAVGVVSCGAQVVTLGADGGRSRSECWLPRNLGPVYYHQRGLFLAGTYALRRKIFFEIGGFDARLAHAENTDLAHRLLAYCHERDWALAAIEEPLMTYCNRRELGSGLDPEATLLGAQVILERHGHRYHRHHRAGYANYCAIAGVSSARLGRFPEARRFFADAIRARPSRLRAYGQLLLASVPPLARRFWLGHHAAGPPANDVDGSRQ